MLAKGVTGCRLAQYLQTFKRQSDASIVVAKNDCLQHAGQPHPHQDKKQQYKTNKLCKKET